MVDVAVQSDSYISDNGASQYGDIDQKIQLFLEKKTIAAFLEEYFGFNFDHLPSMAVVLTVFPFQFV